jgi:hypothetical protein
MKEEHRWSAGPELIGIGPIQGVSPQNGLTCYGLGVEYKDRRERLLEGYEKCNRKLPFYYIPLLCAYSVLLLPFLISSNSPFYFSNPNIWYQIFDPWSLTHSITLVVRGRMSPTNPLCA